MKTFDPNYQLFYIILYLISSLMLKTRLSNVSRTISIDQSTTFMVCTEPTMLCDTVAVFMFPNSKNPIKVI
ncbi:hypothetical protein BLOT_002104 [Blomia tropicalis]|nr:hypothetical protein BLOT_002104 [Blomia tropicalis]